MAVCDLFVYSFLFFKLIRLSINPLFCRKYWTPGKNNNFYENFGFLMLKSDLLGERGGDVTNCEYEVVK